MGFGHDAQEAKAMAALFIFRYGTFLCSLLLPPIRLVSTGRKDNEYEFRAWKRSFTTVSTSTKVTVVCMGQKNTDTLNNNVMIKIDWP